MVFHWSLSDSKSPQVSRIFQSILAVVWTISTRPVISMSSGPCTNPLVTLPRSPVTIGIIITIMFHISFNSLARSRYFNFTLWSAGTAKSTILHVLSFLLIIIRSGRLAEIKWSVCISISHSPGQILGCAYTICSNGQTSVSCTIPSGPLCPPIRV